MGLAVASGIDCRHQHDLELSEPFGKVKLSSSHGLQEKSNEKRGLCSLSS